MTLAKRERTLEAVGLTLGVALFGAAAFMTTASRAHAQFSVTIAPPALRVDVRTVAPSPRHVWIGGSWQWTGERYVWAEGRWAQPARAGATWQDVRWTHRGDRWVSTPGRWVTRATVTGYAVSPQAPPRPRWERRGPPPDPDKVWISGYWQWSSGRYGWVAGRWDTPEQPGATWIAPRWRQRERGWTFSPGQWRVRATAQQPAPAPRVVYVQQPAPPARTVYVQQPAPPARTVYVQQPAPAPRVVYVQQPALPAPVVVAPPQQPAVAQPAPRRPHGRGHGRGEGNGNGNTDDDRDDDHDNGRHH